MPTHEAFAKVMVLLGEVYGKEVSELKMEAYFDALSDLTDEELVRAVRMLMRTKKISVFPLPAEIREAVDGTGREIVASLKVEEAMFKVGGYKSVVFDDPVIHVVIERTGGWPFYCAMEIDEWKFRRKDFEKAYLAFAARPLPEKVPGRLPGRYEIANAAEGHHNEPAQIAYVGDRQRALAWMEERKAIGEG
jgi:hypothetical protein